MVTVTMRRYLPLAVLLFASACAGGTEAVPTVPVPAQATAVEMEPLGVTIANCRVTARRGMTTPGACSVVPRHGRNPQSTGINVTADLRAFGRAADYALAHVPNSGGAWDLDIPVPADFPPGTVPITFRVTDAQGRSAATVVSLAVQ